MGNLKILSKNLKLFIVLFVTTGLSIAQDTELLFDCVVLPKRFIESQPQIHGLLSTLSISPKARELFETIKSRHNQITLNISDRCVSAGNFIAEDKEINISVKALGSPTNFCEIFLWEMCNAANYALALPSKFSQCKDEYAFFTEAAEYQSYVKRTDILIDYFKEAEEIPHLKLLIEEAAGNKISTIISLIEQDSYESFKNYWESVNKKTEKDDLSGEYVHANVYRDFYAKNELYFLTRKSTSLTPEMLGLVKYAFSFWKDSESIPFVDPSIKEFYNQI